MKLMPLSPGFGSLSCLQKQRVAETVSLQLALGLDLYGHQDTTENPKAVLRAQNHLQLQHRQGGSKALDRPSHQRLSACAHSSAGRELCLVEAQPSAISLHAGRESIAACTACSFPLLWFSLQILPWTP